jgi:hypothetical protein
LAIGLAGYFCRKPAPVASSPLWVLIILGVLVGEFAAFQFPNVLDSIQVLQVQQYILGWDGGTIRDPTLLSRIQHFLMGGLTIPPQPGFAGLIFVPSLLQLDLPVVTVASGGKVMLMALAAVVSDYAVERFGFRPRLLAASLLFATMVFSQFGFSGLMNGGKDSIYAVLMAFASICAAYQCESDAHEAGLFMAAAILLGSVVVPFLLVFWFVFFVVSAASRARLVLRQAIWSVVPLTVAVVGVHGSASGTATIVALLPMLIAAAAACAAAALLLRKVDLAHRQPTLLWQNGLSVVPGLCIVAIGFLLPARVSLSRAPLDGLTTGFGLFYELYPNNNPWVATAALLFSALLPLLSQRFRTPFAIALFSFLPATALIALLNLHWHLHVLTDFNIWDITKDTVQWYVGAFSGLIVLLGVRAAIERLPARAAPVGVPLVCMLFAGGLSQNFLYFKWLLDQPKFVTSSGAFLEESSAKAMDYLWRHARGARLVVSRDSGLADFFWGYQMFGARDVSIFNALDLAITPSRSVYLANAADAQRVVRFANQHRGSVTVIGLGDDAFVVDTVYDGKGLYTERDVPKVAVRAVDGAYAVEAAPAGTFRWIGPTTTLVAVAMSPTIDEFCTRLTLINPWADEAAAVTIDTGTTKQTIAVPADATFSPPFTVHVCAPVKDGTATLILRSVQPARRFANGNDSREVSFGLVWPVTAD